MRHSAAGSAATMPRQRRSTGTTGEGGGGAPTWCGPGEIVGSLVHHCRSVGDMLGVLHGSDAPVARLRLSKVVSFHRKTLGQTGEGHFSPLGGYSRRHNAVLVMDVARFKCGHADEAR